MRLDFVALDGQGHRLGTARSAELRHRVADVRADRLGREHQGLGDLGAAHSSGQHPEDLALTRRQGRTSDPAPDRGPRIVIFGCHSGRTLAAASGSLLVLVQGSDCRGSLDGELIR